MSTLLFVLGAVVAILIVASVLVRQVRELVLHPIEAWHVLRFLLVGNKKQDAPAGSTPEQV
jgi:hypothetical protein